MQLENFTYINRNDLNLVEEYLNAKCKKYILGRNKWADSILKHINVDGIIDDFTSEEYYGGIKVYKSNSIPRDSIVVSATMGGPQTAKNKLNSLGIKNIDYFAFYRYSKLDLASPPFMEDFSDDFQDNLKRYEIIFDKLADVKSKKVFKDVLNFKITYDLNFMNNYANDMKLQYFEDDFYVLPQNPVFVDGGGIQVTLR